MLNTLSDVKYFEIEIESEVCKTYNNTKKTYYTETKPIAQTQPATISNRSINLNYHYWAQLWSIRCLQ